jgi:hypothetical protein
MSAKTPARLSSGLLSRKGMAAPSAAPETRTNMVGSLGAPDAAPAETTRPRSRQGPAPARSMLADWVAPEVVPQAGARTRRGRGRQNRVRVSLRLDEDRHARLKLAAAQRNCTLQSLFCEAIDEFFIRHAPDLHGISARLRRGAGAAGAKASGAKTTGSTRRTEGRNGPSRIR